MGPVPVRKLVGVNSARVLLMEELWVEGAANRSNADNALSTEPGSFMKMPSVAILC